MQAALTITQQPGTVPFPPQFFVSFFLLPLLSFALLSVSVLSASSAFLPSAFHTEVLLFSPSQGSVSLWQLF